MSKDPFGNKKTTLENSNSTIIDKLSKKTRELKPLPEPKHEKALAKQMDELKKIKKVEEPIHSKSTKVPEPLVPVTKPAKTESSTQTL